jgi:hypothetical protein
MPCSTRLLIVTSNSNLTARDESHPSRNNHDSRLFHSLQPICFPISNHLTPQETPRSVRPGSADASETSRQRQRTLMCLSFSLTRASNPLSTTSATCKKGQGHFVYRLRVVHLLTLMRAVIKSSAVISPFLSASSTSGWSLASVQQVQHKTFILEVYFVTASGRASYSK